MSDNINRGIDPLSGLTFNPQNKNISQNPVPEEQYDPTEDILSGIIMNKPGRYVGDYFPGGEMTKYDQDITTSDLNIEEIQRQRAKNQPIGGKAFNAIVGGVTSGILTSIEDMAYILDFENNINRLRGLENVESNFIADIMKRGKEDLEKVMPIYKRSDKVFDWSDPGFYFSALKGILDSAVGFAIPGMVASKGIGAIQRAARLSKYLGFMKGSQTTQQMINAGLSGYITNFGEGKMMALEQFENSLAQMEDGLFEENFNILKERNPEIPLIELEKMAEEVTQSQLNTSKRKEFETIAGEQANVFINRNKIFAITDAIGLHGIYKGKGLTRNMLKAKGIGPMAKRLTKFSSDNLLLQAAKEGAEEIGQNVLQMEGEYQSAKRAGFGLEDTPEDFTERMLQFATSDKALLEGMMGLFGGGPQRILTEAVSGNYLRSSKESYKKRYEEQQNQIKANTEFLNAKLGEYSTAIGYRKAAIERGEDNHVEFLKSLQFVSVAANNLYLGTTENLERRLKDISGGVSEEERIANGWDEDYQQQAADQLEELKRMEKRFKSYTRYEDQSKIFLNRETRRLIQKDRELVQEELDEVNAELEGQPNPDPDLISRKADLEKVVDKIDLAIQNQDDKFKTLTSHKYQKEKREQAKKNEADFRAKAREQKANEKQERAEEKAKKRREKAVKKEEGEKVKETEGQEVDVSKIVEEDIDVNKVGDPFIEGPDAKVDVGDLSGDEIENDQKIQELNNNVNQLNTDLVLKSLRLKNEGERTEEEIESDTQEGVEILKQIIDSLTKLNEENVTLSDVIDRLVDQKGAEVVEPMFDTIEELYKRINPDYQTAENFAEFRKLSPEEKRDLEGHRQVKRQEIKKVYTSKTDGQIEEVVSEIQKDLQKENGPRNPFEDVSDVDYIRVERGASVLAYLSREFNQAFAGGLVTREETTNELNENLPTKDILDPAIYVPGTEVVLKIEDNDDTEVYAEGTLTKEKTTWGAKKQLWRDQVNEGLQDEESYQRKFEEQVPVGIYAGDQKIGYLHETEWINDTNVVPENVVSDKQHSRMIRQQIVAKREFKTTINSRTDGYLFISKDGKYINLNEAIPDKELPIVVGSQGEFKISREESYGKPLMNSKEPELGIPYIIVPIGINKELAIPIKAKKLEENEAVINSIMTAIDIFYNERKDDRSNRIVNEILNATNNEINIRTTIGFMDYLQMFLNNFNIGKETNLGKYLDDVAFNEHQQDVFVNMKQRVDDDDVYFQISRGKKTGHVWLAKSTWIKASEEKKGELLDKIRNELGKVYGHVSLDNLSENRDVVLVLSSGEVTRMSYKDYVRSMTTSNVLAQDISKEGEDTKYVYTLQPVINLDFTSIIGEDENKNFNKESEPSSFKEKKEVFKEDYSCTQIKALYQDYGIHLTGVVRMPNKSFKIINEDGSVYSVFSVLEIAEDIVSKNPVYQGRTDVSIGEVVNRVAREREINFNITLPQKKQEISEKKPYKMGMKLDTSKLDSEFPSVALVEEQVEEIKEKTEVKLEGKIPRGVVIRELGISKQEQLVDLIRSAIVNELFENKKVRAGQIYSRIRKDIEENKSIAEENQDDAMYREMDLILNNWDSLVALAEESLKRIDGVKRIDIDQEVDNLTPEEKEQQSENANWSDSSAFTMNPSDGLAPQLKQFLAGINKYKVTSEGEYVVETNYLGIPKTIGYSELYNELQRLTPNLKPSFDDIISILNDIYKNPKQRRTYPYIGELIEKLNSAPQQVKNQFVSGLTNHDINMRLIMLTQDSESGRTILTDFASNRNELSQVVLDKWYNNLVYYTAAQSIEDPSEIVIPEPVKTALVENYEKWIKEKNYPKEEVRDWLEALGITLSDQTFEDLYEGKIRYRGKYWNFNNQVKDPNGVIKILYENIRTRGNQPLASGDRLFEEGAVKALAHHEARYAKNVFSNSHRTGNKTVYSYGQNKYLINRVRDLKRFEDGKNKILDQLKDLSFNGVTVWGRALIENGGDNAFQENFDRWVFSLEPLKRKGTKTRDNVELHNLSEGEIEVAKIGMLQSSQADLSGGNNRVIRIVYPTTSDKTSVLGLRVLAQDLKLDKEGNILDESLQILIDYVVQPEINRIRSFQKAKETNDLPNIESYEEGAEQFLFLPELNTIPGMFLANGSLADTSTTEMQEAIKSKVKDYINSLRDEKIKVWKKNGIGKNGIEYLNSNFMGGTIGGKHNPIKVVEGSENKVKAAATDMVFQYLIANAEIAKLFTGDPALYFKKSDINNGKGKFQRNEKGEPVYDFIADAEETYINIGKRLAADIAPGYEIADDKNGDYIQGFAADAISSSTIKFDITRLLDGQEAFDKIKELEGNELKNAVKGLISEPYYGFKGTDAQELTTWREHLYVMYQAGELTDQDYKTAKKLLEAGKPLERKLLGKLMQPMKPVYVNNQIEGDVDRRIYIKSSSFPLIPQLTAGTQLDRIRQAMEGKEKGKDVINRLAYSTAVKVGNVKNPAKIFDENGNVLPVDQISFANANFTLKRKGFRIQQRVPEKKGKSEMNKVTQASKNLLVNMLNVEGFELPWVEGKMNGSKLQEIYHDVYEQYHKLELEELKKEILDSNGNLNVEKLKKVLQKEARERNYPISDQESLSLDKDLKFLPFSSSANKYEALLNSIVTNRVIRLTLPGKSYVLGSEEGFKRLTDKEVAEKLTSDGIIWVKEKLEKLQPARMGKEGKMLPAQAIAPWKMRLAPDENYEDGKILNIEDYIIEKDGKKFIDGNKVPSEARQLFGMRIPNQGPNSQSWIEIVGFLPEISGDLIIATRDYVVQMGSDFDVDKLYTYQYNIYEDPKNGILHLDRKENNTVERKRRILQNKIIDVHIAIHKNTDPVVQRQIANPLRPWKLKDISSDIAKIRRVRKKGEAMFTGLSDEYQRTKFKNAAAGKAGVGVFSLDSMFNAVSQGKDIVLNTLDENDKIVPLEVVFGNKVSNGNLSEELALDGKTYKSDIIAGYQSAAVDNEKEQILDKLNINTHTFKVVKVLNQLGFGEEVPLFIAQDIIIDYVEELERLTSTLSGYTPDKERIARNNVLAMEKYRISEDQPFVDQELANEKATIEKLTAYIKNGQTEPNYAAAQRALLLKFINLDEFGKEIQTLQSTINPDSAGLGKSVMESLMKEDQVFRLVDNKFVENGSRLIGDFIRIKPSQKGNFKGYRIKERKNTTYAIKPRTINGYAIVYGLFENNELWSQLFPYQEAGIEALFEKVEQIIPSSADRLVAAKAERRLELWKDIKSFIFTDESLGLHDTTIYNERRRLLYDKFEKGKHTKESLADVIRRIQNIDYGRNNAFLSRLEPEISKKGEPSIIKYRASTAENADETSIYTAFVDMFTNTSEIEHITFNGEPYTKQKLAQDLVLYSYLTGGVQEAVQFVKYIPAAYLTTIPFAERLSNMSFLESKMNTIPGGDSLLDKYYHVPQFVQQYVQHNPNLTTTIEVKDTVEADSKFIEKITSFKLSDIKRKELEKPILPHFLSIRSRRSTKNFKLFRFDYKEGVYKEVDTLGIFGASEYDINIKDGDSQVSLIERNKTSLPINEQSKAPMPHDAQVEKVKSKEEVGDNTLQKIANGTQKSITFTDGIEKTKSLLNSIIANSKNPYYVSLSEELLNHVDKLPESLIIDITREKGLNYAGRFSYDEDKLSLHATNIRKSKNNSAKVFLHELLHGLTGYKISYYFAEGKKDKNSKELIERLDKNPSFSFTEKDRTAIKSIQVLMNQAKQKIISDSATKTAYESFKAKMDKRTRGELFGSLSDKEISMFYGLDNIKEFVTLALTDSVFQNLLNSVQTESKKTFWQALKERIVRLLNVMSIQIEKGSVLEAAVYDVFDLIENEEKILTKIKKPIVRMDFEDGTGGREMRLEFRGKSTMDLILSGNRTATSRNYKPNYKVGDRIIFEDKKGRQVEVEVTKSPYKVSSITPAEWSKLEGWAEFVYKPNYYQYQFKVISSFVVNLLGEIVSPNEEFDADLGNMVSLSYMPAAETQRLGPKFGEIITSKEIERRLLYQDKGKLLVERRTTENEEKKRVISRKLQRVQTKIDKIENDLLELNNLDRLDQIEKYAEEDLKTLEAIFNKREPSLHDLGAAKRLIDMWMKAGDFSGNEPHIFYDPEELANAIGGLKDITEKFTSWRTRAEAFNLKLLKEREKAIKREGRIADAEFSKPVPDVGFFTKNLLDISEVDHVLFQTMHKWNKDANFAAKEELDEIYETLDKLIENTGLKNFDLFKQTFSNTDNRETGELVFRWTQAFFDWQTALHQERKRVVDANKGIKTKASRASIVRANRNFINKLRENTEMFDPRILFYDSELYTGKPPTEKQQEEYKAKLRELLGDSGYEEYYNINKRKIEDYKEDLKSHRAAFESHFSENQAEVERQISVWIMNNSPYVYAEMMEKGYDSVRIDGMYPNPTNNYVRVVPKRQVNGKDTGFHDEKFKKIEENDSYRELYNYMFDLLETMKLYLPNEKVGFMQLNSIPTLKKKMTEVMIDENLLGGFHGIRDRVLESVRMDDLSDVSTSEERKEFQFNMLVNHQAKINSYIKLKDTTYRAENDGKAPSQDQIAEWRKNITNELAKEKSFDLGRVMKAFASMALVYKHKATIEDQMRIAHDIINDSVQRQENAAGEQTKDKYGNLLSAKHGLTNLKKMMDDFMEVAYWGYASNRPEGKGKKKVLTKKEKEFEDLLNRNKEELDQLLTDKKIDEDTYNARLEVINEQLAALGGVKVLSKYGDVLLKYIQLKGMGWNVFAAFANIGFGFISNVIEGSDGRNYSMKNFMKAQALVLNSVGRNFTFNSWDGINGTAKKIRSLMNSYDTLKESRNEIYKDSAPNLFRKIGKRIEFINPYAPQTRSEYFNQAPVMIAAMMQTMIKLESGEEISVWDAYDNEGNLKEGITFDRKERFALKRRIDKLVKMNHGNYDPDSPLSAKRAWMGRALSQFRTWAFQGFAERFKAEFKDYQLNNQLTGEDFLIRKGRYRSYVSFFQEYNGLMGTGSPITILMQLFRKLLGFNTTFDQMVSEDGKFTEVDAANMRKNMTELVLYMIITAFTLALRASIDDDDERKRKRKSVLVANFMINQASRLSTDILFYTNPIEFEKLTRNAVPAFSLVVDGYTFLESAWKYIRNGEEGDILQNGPNEGESRTWRDFKKLVPGPAQIQKLQSASQQIYKKR